MRIRFLVSLLVLLAAACTGSCAGTSNGIEDPPPPPPPPTASKAYVAVDGDDGADGSQSTPYRTITKALTSTRDWIVVGPGTFAEAEITVTRKVRIMGDEGAATILDGHLLIASNDVAVERLNILGGVAIGLAENVTVESATIAHGLKDDTISISSSIATLRGLSLVCGSETCVQVTTSTATIENVSMTATIEAKRGLRVESANVSVSGIRSTKMNTSQLQAGAGSTLVVRGATLYDARGNGLVALAGATVLADDVRTTNIDRFGLLAQEANVTMRNSELGEALSVTVGIQAGNVTFFDTVVHGSREGTISMHARSRRPPTVRYVRGEVRHGDKSGILQGAGALRVEGTRFVGDPNAPPAIDDRDAIATSGMDTSLIVDGATFLNPAGAAILIRSHAGATITATITGPRTAGVVIDGARVNPILVRGRIEDCVRESGLAAFDSELVAIEDLIVTGCAEAGVLAGASSIIDVRRVRSIDNPGFGFAAFGGSVVRLSDSTARGSQWATFATCADGSSVVDEGGNQLDGATTECP